MTDLAASELDSPYPSFLSWLDTNPVKAFDSFYEFTWKLLLSQPPRALRSLEPDSRIEVIADTIERCREDGFRRLRSYRDMGRPFAAWLMTVARNLALDRLERLRRERGRIDDVDPDTLGVTTPDPLPPGLVDVITRSLEKMGEKCRKLATCYANWGLTGKALAEEMGWPSTQGKKASDDLRYCLAQLKQMLLAEGLKPEEVV